LTSDSTPCLDTAVLDRIKEVGGDALLAKLIDLFLDLTPQHVEAVCSSEKAGDMEGVEHAAHSIRSSGGFLGALALCQVAEKIENLAEKKGKDQIPALLGDLQSNFEEVKARMAEERKSLGS